MEVTKGEDWSDEQGPSAFGTSELESQRRDAGRSKRSKIIIVVLLVCLLGAILALALSLRSRGDETDADGAFWLQAFSEETPQLHCPPGFARPPLILVSLDGFRSGYLNDHGSHLPIIGRLRNAGTTTPYLRPVYPTKTFPNHYSIVTGLYPESHGIVDNKMYDVTRNAFFSLKSQEKFSPKWYQGEPVWITAMRQKLKTGTFFWPGSDVAINGSFPDFYNLYDKSISFERRVSKLFEWLSLPQGERPDFYTLYLEEPDASGHRYGPGSKEVIQALEEVDRIMGMLMDGLTEKNLHHCVNLMIVSDHGMEEASCEKAALVSTYQENTDGFNVIQGPAARIRPARLPEDYFSFDYDGLVKNLSCRAPDQPMRPYLKENLPKRMHFANNKRIERGHLYMKQGWQAALNHKEVKYCTGGFHGSDNLFTNMQAIFIGYGPGFKTNAVVPPFENIELYNVMCDLLGIRPAPNNGTHGSLNHLLRHPFHLPVHPAQLSHDSPCEARAPVPADDQCVCTPRTKTPETDLNRHLTTTNSSAKVALRRLHHPFGTPRVVQPDATFCLLYNSDYLTGYSRDRLMPLWVSYTVRPATAVRPLSPELEACVRADVRVPPAASQLCHRYNFTNLSLGLLHPPSLSADGPVADSLITSNMAPMFPAFKDVWTHFHEVLLPQYSQRLNGVNVVSGPIFDQDFDGNVDTFKATSGKQAPVPTHFFVMLTSCGNATFSPVNCRGPLQAKSFVLPHRPDHTESCANGSDMTWAEDWLHFHTARVRDIELLTGLSFYHDRLSVEETLQLKTFLQTA
ncbi:ectonucleotide pyrophosphatase/phosphodiesterase family member 1 isoform X2 [Scophthalmus maximus]|uniref:ectonucleotide pyrophosphatase/phosphodiesterase family member 1 isoform X2 n=1 Tax=Scophthalmus maximus TaxID=52904 RepID=UPI001FA879D5|nr:ectonucleotide pyrophosphatase/phosphodiesterase family member 1 isoform X2 [Scophthalmus maximus]